MSLQSIQRPTRPELLTPGRATSRGELAEADRLAVHTEPSPEDQDYGASRLWPSGTRRAARIVAASA